jgi:hypothetical protein
VPTLTMAMATRGERANYLSLALHARSTIRRLRSVAPGSEPVAELRSALQAALNSLDYPNPQGGELCSKLYDEGGLNRFEDVQTVEEVITTLDDADLKDEIVRVLSGKGAESDVRGVMRFFSALENRALYHYDDPSLAETFL